jgi:Glycosyl hydrolase family 12
MAQNTCARRRLQRPSHRRVGAAILSLACASAAVAACGQSAPSHGPVVLVPKASASGQSWDWTASCQFAPKTAGGCAPSGPVLGAGQLAGDEWNLGTGSGTSGAVAMSLDPSGELKVNGNLTSAPPCTASTCLTRQGNTWVRGYPSVLYGTDQCHAETSPPPSSDFRLPTRVDAIPNDLVGRTVYDAQGGKVTYDVAYDLWLNASDTTTPCQTNGTVEVMVWTDYGAQALLPDNLKVGTTTVPYSVDGEFKSGTQSWSVYVNNIFGSGQTVAWGGTVWLVLDAADITKHGAVNVDLSAALADVGSLLESRYGWAPFASTYWLDTIAFGMEFGPQGGDPYGHGPANFALNLSKYCLQAGKTVPTVTC